MRLATRTGLASFVAASITLLAVGSLFRGYFAGVLQDRVDTQLRERAETAPILAAVAERLSQSELRTTLEGARVVIDGQTISLGLLPDDPLPDTIVPGFSTARANGDRWRMYSVDVLDVPRREAHMLVAEGWAQPAADGPQACTPTEEEVRCIREQLENWSEPRDRRRAEDRIREDLRDSRAVIVRAERKRKKQS